MSPWVRSSWTGRERARPGAWARGQLCSARPRRDRAWGREALALGRRRQRSGSVGWTGSLCAVSQVYKGYVDDPRNTDNAWIETVAVSVHFPDQSDVELKQLNSVRGSGCRPRGRMGVRGLQGGACWAPGPGPLRWGPPGAPGLRWGGQSYTVPCP